MGTRGFTLIEVTIATALMVVVTMMSFMAVQSSARSLELVDARDTTQANVTNVLGYIVREVETAAYEGQPPLYDGVEVSDNGREVTFQVPMDDTASTWSKPITFRFENEDVNGDGKLNQGEDENGDQVLTRRVVRVQDGEEMPVGGSNDISNVEFELDEENATLEVTLTASRPIRNGEHVVKCTMSSRISILN